MRTRDVLLLAYDAFGGQISGKTTLQKKMYFLAVKLDYDLGYGAHYYGPYSRDVAAANSELKALGHLKESVSGWGSTDPQGFEIARYDYSLTSDGRRIVDRKRRQHPEEYDAIHRAAQEIRDAGEIGYMRLSVAAKAYFLLKRQGGRADLETIKTVARRFGWSVSELDLERAGEFLEKAGLVTRR